MAMQSSNWDTADIRVSRPHVRHWKVISFGLATVGESVRRGRVGRCGIERIRKGLCTEWLEPTITSPEVLILQLATACRSVYRLGFMSKPLLQVALLQVFVILAALEAHADGTTKDEIATDRPRRHELQPRRARGAVFKAKTS
jgi:hypothetical protein